MQVAPTPTPQSKLVTHASRLVAQNCAVGGIRTWAGNPGRRASHLSTLLLLLAVM